MTAALRTRLFHFFYLQLLDLLTTVAFLSRGVEEGNPLVRFAMQAAPNPLLGLAAAKGFACLLGFYCAIRRREWVLGKINVLYAIVIAWNLIAIILGPA